jgi:hypothetical protein
VSACAGLALGLALALGACGGPAGPAAPARPAAPEISAAAAAATAFAWLPAELVTAVRAPGAGAPMLAFFARSPRRPPCMDAALAGVRESLQLQRGRGARMALVLAGALDRERLEACGIEAARALLGVEVAARRDGALTYFERGSERGAAAQVAGFAGERAVLADTADEVRAILAPPRARGPTDPLAPLLPRLAEGELAAITTIDPLAPWTGLPARAASLRLVRSPALRAEARLRYASADEARRARAAVGRLLARDEVPFAIRRALALVTPAVDEAELVIDLSSLFAPEHASLLQGLMRELAPASGTP